MTSKTNEKEAEVLIALLQGCFNRRTELEAIQWKLNFSAWTSIALAGWALHTKSVHLGWWCWVIAAVVVALHSYAIYRFDSSIRTAVKTALDYVADLETLIGHKHTGQRPAALLPWHFVQLVPTLLLTIAAGILIQ
jgi:hypothetical protein